MTLPSSTPGRPSRTQAAKAKGARLWPSSKASCQRAVDDVRVDQLGLTRGRLRLTTSYTTRRDLTPWNIGSPFVRPHRHYVADLGANEAPGIHRARSANGSLPRPLTITIAASRLARAWRAMQKEAEYGSASEFRLIELHKAALRLRSVTGTKNLWSAIDAVGAGRTTSRE